MSIELYAARHGETIANIENRLSGKDTDSPLTKKGIAQALALREKLKDIHFDKVYCSPLQRAIDTVNIVLGEQYEICIDNRLSEIGLGVMDGLTYDEASENYPESGMLFFSSPSLYTPPVNGESIEDVIKRVRSFIGDLESQSGKNNKRTIFMQTHGFLLRVLYSCMQDQSVLSIDNSPYYSNCDIVHYTYKLERWKLR